MVIMSTLNSLIIKSVAALLILSHQIFAQEAPEFSTSFDAAINDVAELQGTTKTANGQSVSMRNEIKHVLSAFAQCDVAVMYDAMTDECKKAYFPDVSNRAAIVTLSEKLKASYEQAGFSDLQFTSFRILQKTPPYLVEVVLRSKRNGAAKEEIIKMSVVMVESILKISDLSVD
jgi:hypothetical protein